MNVYNKYEKSDDDFISKATSIDSRVEIFVKWKKDRYSATLTLWITTILIAVFIMTELFFGNTDISSIPVALFVLIAISYARKESLDAKIKALKLYEESLKQ